MRYVTDERLAEIPALDGLDADAISQALADASRVYKYVRQNEWITDQSLRNYGDRNDLPPDRMNTALAVLQNTGQLYGLDDATPPPPDA